MGKKDVKRVDVFRSSKELSERIAEFLDVQVWSITLATRYTAKIKAYEKVLADKSSPDRVYVHPEDRLPAIERAQRDLDDVKEEYAKIRKEKAAFVFTKEDQEFKKAYKTASTGADVRQAIRDWCGHYGLQVARTDLEERIMGAICGKDVNTARAKVNTGKCNADSRKEGVALKLLYGEVADYMVEKGLTIPMQFDDDIKAKYAPKKKSAK